MRSSITWLIGFRMVDWRYRFGERFAVGRVGGVDRYQLATPAYSIYGGIGRTVAQLPGRGCPKWDLGLDFRYAQNIARDHVLATDPDVDAARKLLQDRERCLVSIAAILIAAILIGRYAIAAIAVVRPVALSEPSYRNSRLCPTIVAMPTHDIVHPWSIGGANDSRWTSRCGWDPDPIAVRTGRLVEFEHERRVHQSACDLRTLSRVQVAMALPPRFSQAVPWSQPMSLARTGTASASNGATSRRKPCSNCCGTRRSSAIERRGLAAPSSDQRQGVAEA